MKPLREELLKEFMEKKDNPYMQEIFSAFALAMRHGFDLNSLILDDGIIPKQMPQLRSRYQKSSNSIEDFLVVNTHAAIELQLEFAIWELYKVRGMYGFVSEKWINPLVKWLNGRTCLEVLSGRGWFAKALRDKGCNVIATDNFSSDWDADYYKEKNMLLTEVEELDAIEAVKKYGSQVDFIIMSWAPYESSISENILYTMREVNPNLKMIYIGALGSYTDSPEFAGAKNIVDDKEFYENVKPNFENWHAVSDCLLLVN